MLKTEFINGPTNYCLLKGNIDGIDKKIHIFFDKHLDLNDQTECESFDSVDISYYLYRLIKQTNVNLDFFMEISTKQLDDKIISNKRDIYIQEVIKLFKTEFDLKKNNDSNIAHSNINSNVKLHYFDIRDHLDIYILTKIINQKIEKYFNYLNINITEKTIEKILYYVNQINDKLELLVKNTKEVQTNLNSEYDKVNEKQKYHLHKILNQYQNEILKKKINFFLDIHINGIISSINYTQKNIEYILKNLDLTNINELKKNIDKLGEYILQLYTFYTDTYLLRRILDKNYVKNCIIYSGGSHCVNFIFFLVKYCNFNIIKINYSKEKNINLLTNIINEKLYSYDIYELFLQKKIFIQCIHWEPIFENDFFSANLKKKYLKYNKNNSKK